MCFVFFFKQKTAYDMRFSDWSSDVCSSDLASARRAGGGEIGGAFDLDQQVRMFADHLVPAGDRLHRSAETIGPVADLCDGHADNVDGRCLRPSINFTVGV